MSGRPHRPAQALKVLPVDIPALQTCSIGKTLSKLRKTAPESLQRDVSLLVTEWKKLLAEPAPANGASAGLGAAVGEKRPR